MKIGIISYHIEPNYGTMLQAYALEKAIKREGVKCEYINYFPYKKPSRLKCLVKRIIDFLGIKLKNNEFDFFSTKAFKSTILAFNKFHRNYIGISESQYYSDTIHESNELYDYFIVGSDQTWSPYMTSMNNCMNFLQFVSDNNKKRAYAPSIGTTHINELYLKTLINELRTFEFISCRERSNCKLLASNIDKPVNYVLDPTLLLSPNEWNSIAVSPAMAPKSYILAYILGEKECVSEYAENLGKAKGLPVYYIVTRPCYLTKTNNLTGIGPEHFLGLIRDAAFVVTDSFHGSIFSINYGVNFYSFAKRKINNNDASNDNDRIIEFLKELNLENRFKEDDDGTYEENISYSNVETILSKLRADSKEYLRNIISH